MRPPILIFCDFYLPGFKSGGGTSMLTDSLVADPAFA
jgi:hypothetical protein